MVIKLPRHQSCIISSFFGLHLYAFLAFFPEYSSIQRLILLVFQSWLSKRQHPLGTVFVPDQRAGLRSLGNRHRALPGLEQKTLGIFGIQVVPAVHAEIAGPRYEIRQLERQRLAFGQVKHQQNYVLNSHQSFPVAG